MVCILPLVLHLTGCMTEEPLPKLKNKRLVAKNFYSLKDLFLLFKVPCLRAVAELGTLFISRTQCKCGIFLYCHLSKCKDTIVVNVASNF